MIKSVALWLVTKGADFSASYEAFRIQMEDPKKKNYQVAIRPSGIVIKHLPTKAEKHYLRI